MSGKRTNIWLLAFSYILSFILLREWLMPVMDLGDTDYLELFLMFIILTFIFYLFRAKWWISGPVKIFYVFWVLHYVYIGQLLFSKDTISELLRDVFSNFSILINGNWQSLTNPFRTILFFVLLWMTTYLIRHWVEARKSILLFYVMTVVFIAFMDTFSAYSASGAILRIMVAGLLLVGLLYISKLTTKYRAMISPVALVIPLLFVVISSGALANVLPKQDPVWADPVPFIKSLAEGAGEGGSSEGVSRSGYDPDDSKLGGAFLPDDTLVFEASVERKQYWKIETKNTYTSKGWEQLSENESYTNYSPGIEIGENVQDSEEEDRTKAAVLEMSETYPFLIYPYGLTMAFADEEVQFLHSEATGHYWTLINGNEGSLNSYSFHFVEPNFSLKALRDTTLASLETLGNEFNEYLQLPEGLPQRVRDLASSISENQDNVYDKTKAIERYFARSGFVYDQRNVATPSEEEDYVDQFLFDTKRGYCDNFSTSMVVMLRSIGVPARWVKGFAPGEVSQDAEGNRIYQITNNEAHSWVEAYMPGIGWVPFEPTIGFNNPASISYDIELEENDPEIPERTQQEQQEPEKPEEKVVKASNFDFSKMLSSIGKWVKEKLWILLIVLAIVCVVSWRIYVARSKWLPKILIPVYRSSKEDWDAFSKRYKSLLKQLDRFGLKRKNGLTLSVYAEEIDRFFGGDRMKRLTQAYEKGLYGDNTTDHDWKSLNEVWEDLINKTSG